MLKTQLSTAIQNSPSAVDIHIEMPIQDWPELNELPQPQARDAFKHAQLSIDGSPCQGISAANKENKKEFDQRNCLAFRQAYEVVHNSIPFSCKENSVGLLQKGPDNKEPLINEILRYYVLHGYQVQIYIMKGYYFGIPQGRQRCFLIAYKIGFQMPLQSIY